MAIRYATCAPDGHLQSVKIPDYVWYNLTSWWWAQQCSKHVQKYHKKCTLAQTLKLCTGRASHSGSRGIALLFLDHGTRKQCRSASRPGRFLPPGKTWYPFYKRLGGPQSRSGRAENLFPTGIWTPDRPARSQSLYRLSYRAHREI